MNLIKNCPNKLAHSKLKREQWSEFIHSQKGRSRIIIILQDLRAPHGDVVIAYRSTYIHWIHVH